MWRAKLANHRNQRTNLDDEEARGRHKVAEPKSGFLAKLALDAGCNVNAAIRGDVATVNGYQAIQFRSLVVGQNIFLSVHQNYRFLSYEVFCVLKFLQEII